MCRTTQTLPYVTDTVMCQYECMNILSCGTYSMMVDAVVGGPDEEVDAELICPVADRFCCCLPLSIRKKMHCGIDHSTKLKEVRLDNKLSK